jgi:hypothetical protein
MHILLFLSSVALNFFAPKNIFSSAAAFLAHSNLVFLQPEKLQCIQRFGRKMWHIVTEPCFVLFTVSPDSVFDFSVASRQLLPYAFVPDFDDEI